MRFLVTGLPRMRSAWLAALFASNQVRCIHEIGLVGLDAFRRMTGTVGVFDPAAPLMYPDEDFDLRIVVRRDAEVARRSLQLWFGCELPHWHEIESALKRFEDRYHPEVIAFESLDDFDALSALHRRCTGAALSVERFELFDKLKIEQHRDKAERIYARSMPELIARVNELRNWKWRQ